MSTRGAALILRESSLRRLEGSNGEVGAPRYRAQIVDSIDLVDAAQWDALAGDAAVTRSHAYLQAIERADIPGVRYYYALVFDNRGALAAHACVYLVTTDFAQLVPAALRSVVGVVRRAWPGFLTARITECATPLSAGRPLSLAADADPAAVLGALESAMARLARAEGSSLLVLRDFFTDDLPASDCLRARGYKRVSNMPLARIRIRWRSYADYLAHMRARYRKDLKRRLARARREARQVVVRSEFGDDCECWARQSAAVQSRARSFKREALTAAYYANMSRLPTADRTMLVVERHGAPLAHGMVLFDRDHAVATFFGREPGPPGGEWFMLMNEAVRLAIERGVRTLELGLGSYDAKSLFGAEREPLFVYARGSRGWLNLAIRLVPDLLQQRAVRPRQVFSEPPACSGKQP